MIPTNKLLTRFNQCDRRDLRYRLWIKDHALRNTRQWSALRNRSLQQVNSPVIGLVTPVHNTDPAILRECILSVKTQAYPYWQWRLVDDGSSRPETKAVLASALCADARIEVIYADRSQGISAATNRGISQTRADYVLFLDHDDRLAPEALYYIARELSRCPGLDIVYADRDMISPQGQRCMHLFKPDWSPETLLAGNYVFHPMCYRKQLLTQIGGLRSEFDGSQDYDLVLRAAETNPKVRHIPRVLYHWRQHDQSVALAPQAKEYVFAAGIRALQAAVQRRGLRGKAVEIEDLWRGNYQLELAPMQPTAIEVIALPAGEAEQSYAAHIHSSLQSASDKPYIALISDAIRPHSEEAISGLAAWLQLQDVGLVSGKLINGQGFIDYCGMIIKRDGRVGVPYRGYPEAEPGYMAVTRITRNISAPHPYCVVFRRDLWRQLGGFNSRYQGHYALLDFALRAMAAGWRCLSVPQYRFVVERDDLLQNPIPEDLQLFVREWETWLQTGDPYFNPNLDEHSINMTLKAPKASGRLIAATACGLARLRNSFNRLRSRNE